MAHPIGVVAERTGLSPDVIRVWERRYEAVRPTRGPRGKRVYTDADIERLRLLRRASAGGRSIGEVARLSTAALAALVREDETELRLPRVGTAAERAEEASLLETLYGTAAELDAAGLTLSLKRAIAILGLPRALDGIVVPLLRRLGEGWQAGRISPAHTHLASGIVRRVLEEAAGTQSAAPASPLLLLATCAGERHELGLTLLECGAALEGWRAVVLGTDLPASEIALAGRRMGARAVGLSAVHTADLERTAREIEAVRRQLAQEVMVLAGGAAAVRLSSRLTIAGVRVAGSTGELRAVLQTLYP